jgi:hypothetical protein
MNEAHVVTQILVIETHFARQLQKVLLFHLCFLEFWRELVSKFIFGKSLLPKYGIIELTTPVLKYLSLPVFFYLDTSSCSPLPDNLFLNIKVRVKNMT